MKEAASGGGVVFHAIADDNNTDWASKSNLSKVFNFHMKDCQLIYIHKLYFFLGCSRSDQSYPRLSVLGSLPSNCESAEIPQH